jgi:hypothetical protein
MEKLALLTITLSLQLSLALWRQQPIVAAISPPMPATFNVPAGDVNALIAAINAANNETATPGPDTIVLEGARIHSARRTTGNSGRMRCRSS